MLMSVVHVYNIPQVVILCTGTGAQNMNFPVSRTDIKLSKNVENTIDIYVRDIDRKPSNPPGILTLRILDRKNRRVVASTPLLPVDLTKARYAATVSGLDLVDVDLGWYDYTVAVTGPTGLESLLFTDRDRTEVSTVEVRQGPFPDYVDAITLAPDDFLNRDDLLSGAPTRYTEAMPGAAQVRNVSGISSFAVYGNHLRGTIVVQGSLDAMPTTDDTQWFDAFSADFDDMTGIQGFTFEGNYTWVRFKLVDLSPADIPEQFLNGCGPCSCIQGCPVDGETGNGLITPINWPEGTPIGLVKLLFRA